MEKDIKDIIDLHIPDITQHWESYNGLFKKERLPAKTILLAEDLAKKMFFIADGGIRLYFNDRDKDITMQFFLKARLFVGCYRSALAYYLNQLSYNQ